MTDDLGRPPGDSRQRSGLQRVAGPLPAADLLNVTLVPEGPKAVNLVRPLLGRLLIEQIADRWIERMERAGTLITEKKLRVLRPPGS